MAESRGETVPADALRDLLDAAEGRDAAQATLLGHYRTGSRPSEAFWRRSDEAKARWNDARRAARNALHEASASGSKGDQ